VQRLVLWFAKQSALSSKGLRNLQHSHIANSEVERDSRDECDKLVGTSDADSNVPVGDVSWWLESPVEKEGVRPTREAPNRDDGPFDEVGRVVEAEGGICILDVVVSEEIVDFLALRALNGSAFSRKVYPNAETASSPRRHWPDPS